jgi:tetratricopeptide (TPR) repeat protein
MLHYLDKRKFIVTLVLFGLLAGPAEAAKIDGLNEAMMGENISGGWGDFAIDAKDSFTRSSREVIWFASFKGIIGAPEAKLSAEWVTPAGEVFKKEKFSTQWGNSRFGWAKLDIQGADRKALELEGEWTVRVYWDEEKIDTRTFYLGEKKFRQVQAPPADQSATVEGHILLAKTYYAKNDHDRAAEELLKAEALDPNAPEPYIILGNVYNAMGEPDRALLQFVKAKTLKGEPSLVHRGMTNTYIKLELYEDAIKEYEALVKLGASSKEDMDKLDELRKHRESIAKNPPAAAPSPPSAQKKAKTAPPAPLEAGRFVRVMAGGRIVYEGPEQVDPDLWKTEKAPFSPLKTAGPATASKSIALLVYPYDLDISTKGFAFDRGKYMANEIVKTGLSVGSIRREATLPEQYKYLLRYSLDRKRIEVNFLTRAYDVDFNLIEYSEEKHKVKNPASLMGSGTFPHDLSGHVSRKAVERLTQNGYRVLDLTASRDELAGMTLDAVLKSVHEKYGINKVMFMPIKAYTKWIWNTGTGTRTEYGLLLCYAAAVFEQGKPEPVFTFTDNIDAGDAAYGFLGTPRKTISPARINFYSEDWSEDRKKNPGRPIKFYKDGVIDDAWAAKVVLEKFAGVPQNSQDRSGAGGALFSKLSEAGL